MKNDNFNYAHNDTSSGERKTPTAIFNIPSVSDKVRALRAGAFSRRIPVADDETLNFLITLLSAVRPKNILELGTAVGVSGAVMLGVCPEARLTTIERDENFYAEALANFSALKMDERVTAVCGDAGEVLETLGGEFDFIFLDCAKAQYIKYLPRLKKLLKKGGVLLADDVLLYGWITGEEEVPKKRKMLARHVKEFVDAVTNDKELTTTILNTGDGLSLSVKL
ncbi:MAG: O-methyltransferase [Clostridia bacterium]|nr:O-methyltransferase [Clostridia bacterium]